MKSLIITGLALTIMSFTTCAASSPVYDVRNDNNMKKLQRTLEENNKILGQQNILLKQIVQQQIIANKQAQQEQKEMKISEFSSSKDNK